MNIITPVFAVTLTITSLVAANQATKPIDMPIHDTGTIKFENTEKLKPIETSKLEPKQIKPPKAVASPPASSSVKAEQVSKSSSATPTNGSIEQIIRDAAARHGVSGDQLVRIAKCESNLNSSAVNRGYNENGFPSGLFQHLSGYYPARAAKYGYKNDVFDAYSNAGVTAAMFTDGQSYQWQCR